MNSGKNTAIGVVSESTPNAAQRLANQGAKGFAGRKVAGAAAGRADNARSQNTMGEERLALKRIPTRKSAKTTAGDDDNPPRTPEASRSRTAAQAALGLLGDAAKNADHVADRLGQMAPDELQRLAKLVSVAGEAKDGKGALLEKVDQQLADRGIKLLVKAGSVTINIGTQAPSHGAPDEASHHRPVSSYNSWARQCSRIRDFLLGH